jgi:hypothetical protein
MDVNQLTTVERDLLVKTVETEIDQIDSDIQQLLQRKHDLEALVEKLKNGGATSDESDSKTQSWLRKTNRSLKQLCIESLEKIDDFQITSDVYEYIRECYPESKNGDRDKIIASLSWSLSQLSETGLVVKIDRKFSKGFFWGLPQWFNVDGKPLGEYERKLFLKGVPDFVYKPKTVNGK